MPHRYILSPRAQFDIEEIWDYTAKHWGVAQAESYVRRIWHNIEELAARPAIGRPCPEIREDYYRYRSGSHILFYRISASDIDIIRILHERMDFERHV